MPICLIISNLLHTHTQRPNTIRSFIIIIIISSSSSSSSSSVIIIIIIIIIIILRNASVVHATVNR